MAQFPHQDVLEEKLEFFCREAAIASDPDQKFHIRKRIEEIRAELDRELRRDDLTFLLMVVLWIIQQAPLQKKKAWAQCVHNI